MAHSIPPLLSTAAPACRDAQCAPKAPPAFAETGKHVPETTEIPKAAPSAHERHEALCTRCGKCCYKKIILGSTVYITPFPCEFLDTESNTCTIYERRHELNPECLTIEEGMRASAFPGDCPYVPEQAPPDYRPALEGGFEAWFHFDKLADELGVSEETREKVRARGPGAPPMWLEAYERIQGGAPSAPSVPSSPPIPEQAPRLSAFLSDGNPRT